MTVSTWLHGLGMGRYAEAFEANHVDANTLPMLTQADLVEIGVTSVGHRRRLLAAIAALGQAEPGEPAVESPRSGALPSATLPAERRVLSVLYCELISTELHLQPEDMREVVRLFHDACTATVAEYDGHSANFYGDCLLAYFGWPRAHEDDVERAVRTGLELMRQVPKLSGLGQPLSGRVGIATGEVVVGDLIHQGPAQDQSAVGLVPNLGARLLNIALAGQVVVDELTRRLLPPNFALQPLGQHRVKGLSEPVAAYCVVEEHLADSRFDARQGPALDPMIGRDQELELLLSRWGLARDGEGQVALLVGEAGIGKSRLTRALLNECAALPHQTVRWQCSPYHMGSALWPVVQRLSRAAELDIVDSNEQALDKLEATVGSAESASLYAALLGLNGTQRYGPLQMTPQMLRELTLELLAEQLHELAERQPLLLVVEDAHWIDATTRELLGRCMDRIDSSRMLILITSRPDNQLLLGDHPSVTRLSLSRLSRASVQGMVTRLGGGRLKPHTLAAIVAQSDGVPLFAEELTKAVLETGQATIPASLHGSLMARLGRDPEVKMLAQVAACIGREFDSQLLQSVADLPADAVDAGLEKLVAAELVFRHGSRVNTRYVFKHALVQEAAYQSMLRGKRRLVHACIVQVLQGRKGTPHEVLAHHAQQALQVDDAVKYWRLAAEHALQKSAYVEANGSFENAIGLLRSATDGVDRRLLEVELLVGLSGAWAVTTGSFIERYEEPLLQASRLLDAITGNHLLRLRVQYSLWYLQCARGTFREALRLAEAMFVTVRAAGEQPDAIPMSWRWLASSNAYLGNFALARVQYEQAMPLLESVRAEELIAGVDQRVTMLYHYSWMLCICGFADRGRQLADKAQGLCGAQAPANLKATMYLYLGLRAAIVCDGQTLTATATALREIAAQHQMSNWWPDYSKVLSGWEAMGADSVSEQDIAAYKQALHGLDTSGRRALVPFYLARLALGAAAVGRDDDARELVERALTMCQQTSQGWCDAELWRIRGELCLRREPPDEAQARLNFEKALELAREQGARLWELRAALGMARWWARRGEGATALNLLGPIYDGFTEGFDTRDLVDARTLLRELREAAV